MATQTEESDAAAMEYVAGMLSRADLLAMACVKNKHDFAAWQTFCDLCEEIDEPLRPRALWNAVLGIDELPRSLNELTSMLAYGVDDWEDAEDSTIGDVVDLWEKWALPLAEKAKE